MMTLRHRVPPSFCKVSPNSFSLVKRALLIILRALILALIGFNTIVDARAQEHELVVFAAASLTNAFREIERTFTAAHKHVKVILHFAGSQQLAHQLALGSPADVFAAANHRQMEVAMRAGRIEEATHREFARNRLAIIVPHGNPAGIKSLNDLSRPGIKLVVAAREVPVGRYSIELLEKASSVFGGKFKEQVFRNVVSYEQNVRGVFTKVLLGEADVGIVYNSDIVSDASGQVLSLPIPQELETFGTYTAAVTNDSKNREIAVAFLEYLRSQSGRNILQKHGFSPLREP